MDARELKQIIEGIADHLPEAILANKGFEHLVYSITRIASYLESEQNRRILLDRKIEEHQRAMREFDLMIWGDKNDVENKPGLAHEWASARKQSKRNERLILGVLTLVTGAIVIGILQMLGVRIR